MAPTIVATPKAENANSYVELAAATAYLEDARLFATGWSSADADDQARALIWATFLIDSSFHFKGVPTTTEQALRFPRYPLIDADGYTVDRDTIPVIVEKATVELAHYLIQKDRTADPDLLGLGFREAKVGPLTVKVDEKAVRKLIPHYIPLILEPFGHLKPESSAGGSGVVRLVRG